MVVSVACVSHAVQQQTSAESDEPTATPPPNPSPIPHAEGVSNDEFRAAMARLAAGVVLIAAHDPEEGTSGSAVGMTATAFLSVSLDPPLVLISLRTGSRTDELLERQDHWAVSLLTDEQRQVAGRFSMKGRLSDELLFRELPHTLGEASGAPLVDGALAALECRTEERMHAGDHTLVLGRVLRTRLGQTDREPLLYYRSAYRTLG